MRVSNMKITVKNKHLTDTAKVSVFVMRKKLKEGIEHFEILFEKLFKHNVTKSVKDYIYPSLGLNFDNLEDVPKKCCWNSLVSTIQSTKIVYSESTVNYNSEFPETIEQF